MSKAPQTISTPSYPVDCTTSVAAPVLDTVCASYFAVNAVALAAGAGNYASDARGGGIALSAGLALLCAVSAGGGYSSAKRCEQVKDLNALCITGDESACTRLTPGWRPSGNRGTSSPRAIEGCTMDRDCKGDRICERGACVSPRSPAPSAPAAPATKAGQCERDADCDQGICSEGVCR